MRLFMRLTDARYGDEVLVNVQSIASVQKPDKVLDTHPNDKLSIGAVVIGPGFAVYRVHESYDQIAKALEAFELAPAAKVTKRKR